MPNKTTGTQLRLNVGELSRRVAELEELVRIKEHIGTELRESELRYRRLFESAKDGILILDAESGVVVDVNPFLVQLLGYPHENFCGKCLWEIGVFRDIAASKNAFKVLQESDYIRYDDLPLQTSTGLTIAVEFVSNVYLVDRNRVIQCNVRDITAQKQGEAERVRLSAAIEQSVESILMTDARGDIQFVNPAFENTSGYSRQELLGRNPRLLKSGKQDPAFYEHLWATISAGRNWAGRMVNMHKDGSLYTEDTTISPIRNPRGVIVNYVAVKRDISEQLRLAEQYPQAKKMEAVGLLAGGVAHDYNNMLTMILGYAELALHNLAQQRVDPADLRDLILEIVKAAKHSADITRQLLAFARKQAIKPVVLNLNQTVSSMLKMLHRLIGEDIELTWLAGEELAMVRVDPVQIDQILANLCINARDAIAGVGRVVIETSNVSVDAAFCEDYPEFTPGDYVLLSVSDDGCGMEREMLEQIYEPFFTSKALGQGTGLGLSMVYGIVKQNQGVINVYSEPDHGTTFRIYLPRHLGEQGEVQPEPLQDLPQGQGETILLVEDEPAILKLCRAMLGRLGYHVLTAGSPAEAFDLVERIGPGIRLLITDVILPGMNGRELAGRLERLHPGLVSLYISGYTANVIASRGLLDDNLAFMPKPFSMRDLAIKVREILGPVEDKDRPECVV